MTIGTVYPEEFQEEEEPNFCSNIQINRIRSPERKISQSLADEMQQLTSSWEFNTKRLSSGSIGGPRYSGEESQAESDGDRFDEDSFLDFQNETFEELLAVDPQMITEVEMLQQENALWVAEQKQLLEEIKTLREQKDAFEG